MASRPERIGRYEILTVVGRGGMGTVFRARDPVLDRVVALKVMSPDIVAEAGMRERFLREARSAARLQHPNIVTIFEFGDVDGVPFIAMELLAGDDLAGAVERGRLAGLAARLDVVAQLCDGLAYAHRHGVVHRDVKPSNVNILPGGEVKIVDFGIAWLEGAATRTRTGHLLGTPAYMAPEQFAGAAVDHRVDQWAVGVILYELVTGRRPFDASTVGSLIYQIVHQPPPPLAAGDPELPAEVAAIVERALAKDPGERFAGLDELGQALRRAGPGRSARTVAFAAAAPPPPPNGVAAGATPGVRPAASATHTPTPWHTAFVEDGAFGEARRLQVARLSPDDTLLVVGGTDGSVRVWDLASRTRIATLRNRMHLRTGHGAMTTAVAFSADGVLLASGHLDGAIYLWEMSSGVELDVRLAHDGAVGGLAIPPGGSTLISGGADATIKFWDLPAVRVRDARREIRRQPDAVTCLALAGAGRVVVSGHVNRTLRLHDTHDHRLLATLHGHRAPLAAVAVAPAGDLVASGGRDGAVLLHDARTRERRAGLAEHSRAIAGLAFFPDGRRVASVAMTNLVVISDLADPERPATLQGDAGDAFASVCVTRDGRRLIGASAGGHVRVWRTPAG